MSAAVYFFKTNPTFRLLLAFAGGIVLQYYAALELPLLLICFFITVLLSGLGLILKERLYFKGKFFFGSSVSIALFFAGALTVSIHATPTKDHAIEKKTVSHVYIQLSEDPVEKPNSYKAEGKIIALKDSIWIPHAEKIILYFEKNAHMHEMLKEGVRFISVNTSQRIKSAGNPGAFDYREYCLRQGILSQMYVRGKDIFIPKQHNDKTVSKFFSSTRLRIIHILRTNIADKNSLAVAEALLIGYKIDLDKDLIQAYSNTGVIHIIAISGLHLALIYALILRIIHMIPYLKNKKIKWVFVLCFLWTFSILTGGSPSVLRSAVMFSFIIIGELIKKDARPLNNLTASALCLLIYDPFFLWDAGFQLSYAAVAGIMIFYKPLYNIFYTKNKLLDHFLKLNSVTISAQIFTLPIVIFHFHQFPNLFLFTNLIAVPLSGFILYAELLLITLSFIPFAAHYIGTATSYLISVLNDFITYMNSFVYAVTDEIAWTLPMTLCCMILLISGSIYFFTCNRKLIIVSFLACLCFVTLNAFENFSRRNTTRLIVYNIPKNSAMEILAPDTVYFVGDPNILRQSQIYNFNIRPAHIKFRAFNHRKRISSNVFKIGNCSIFRGSTNAGANADIFIISGNPPLNNIKMSANTHSFLIADNTNARWKINRWKKQADSLHLRFHSIPDDGAFVMEL